MPIIILSGITMKLIPTMPNTFSNTEIAVLCFQMICFWKNSVNAKWIGRALDMDKTWIKEYKSKKAALGAGLVPSFI